MDVALPLTFTRWHQKELLVLALAAAVAASATAVAPTGRIEIEARDRVASNRVLLSRHKDLVLVHDVDGPLGICRERDHPARRGADVPTRPSRNKSKAR